MKNNIIETRDLECPSPELQCTLDKFFKKQMPKHTKIDLGFEVGTRTLTVTVNGVSSSIVIPV